MFQFVADERVPIFYEAKFREYSLMLFESEAHQLIHFCPWCGAELPSSLRDRFFDELEQLGIDYADGASPAKYATDAWWRGREVPPPERS